MIPLGEGCQCDRFGAVECTSCRICEAVCPPGLDLASIVTRWDFWQSEYNAKPWKCQIFYFR